jgi:hypothetical protein
MSDNPIIAAVRRSLQGKLLVPVIDDWRSLSQAELLASVVMTFDDDAIKRVGRLICLALLTGDRRMVKVLADAIKESDHLFNRDREPELLREVLAYLPSLLRRVGLDTVVIKKEIEKRSNCGSPLEQHRWNRIRKALHLPKRPTGRPAKSRHRIVKTVS